MQLTSRTRRLLYISLVAAMAGGGLSACATQDDASASNSEWPSDKVELVVPFEPGGGTDISARRFAKELEEQTGQSVVVVNKPGGGGTVGIGEVGTANADGGTIGQSIDSIMTLQPQLTGNQATATDRFKSIGVSDTPFILVARADAPWGGLDDLAEAAKGEPGKLRISAPGTGTTNDLAARAYALATDTEFVHTPFAGGGIEAVNAVVNGEVELASTTIPVVKGLVEAGQLKIVGVLDDEEIANFPDVPTLSDAGIDPDLIMTSQSYLVFPKETPETVLESAETAIQQVLEEEQYTESVLADGSRPVFSSVADSTQMLEEADAKYGELLAQIPDLKTE